MRLRQWLALRGPGYVRRRAAILLYRYGITPSRAAGRITSCLAMLAKHGCAPTLPTPGRVVERHAQFVRQLQDQGVEIAVHGYDHLDLTAYSASEAQDQLERAAEVFARQGIETYGFRCPYLSYTDELLDMLPKGMFDYSSNRAIWWDVVPPFEAGGVTTIFDALRRFYKPRSALEALSLPSERSNLVEIPVCLPDDLQIHDGLGLRSRGITQAWRRMLYRTYKRGELFVLHFHPELAWQCRQPFQELLTQAAGLQPPVWIARLRDVSSWWREKSTFRATISQAQAGLHVSFTCSERATILVRGLGACGPERPWDGVYSQLDTRTLRVPAEPRPFIGLHAGAKEQVAYFLREQGYIVDSGEAATRCATYVDRATLARLASEVDLINYIEASTGPLVRYWRWPSGAKSALCVTGDLDALTLLDYASRLFAR